MFELAARNENCTGGTISLLIVLNSSFSDFNTELNKLIDAQIKSQNPDVFAKNTNVGFIYEMHISFNINTTVQTCALS